jgi:hypothetical protein
MGMFIRSYHSFNGIKIIEVSAKGLGTGLQDFSACSVPYKKRQNLALSRYMSNRNRSGSESWFGSRLFTLLIIYMKKILDSDWLKGVQLF